MTAENIGNRRSACDRCRSHKLRCERGDAQRCRRCDKANVECITGPALRSGRPQQLGDTGSSQIQFADDHVDSFAARSTPSAAMLLLATPPEIDVYESDSALQQLITPSNLDDFNQFWSQSFSHDISVANGSHVTPTSSPSEAQNERLKKLADLQTNILADLEAVKCCITADKCPEAISPSSSVTSQNLLIGRMLDHSTSLIEILDSFQPCPSSGSFELTCDVPTMFALLSCYISLVRVYRTVLSCILDCLSFLMGLQHPVPQLFPGMHLGGFKLEARLDLQVQILVQVSEDMLGKIETRFGLSGNINEPWSNISCKGKAARLLSGMLEAEANEQPPLYEPRGHCDSLKSILVHLKRRIGTNV